MQPDAEQRLRAVVAHLVALADRDGAEDALGRVLDAQQVVHQGAVAVLEDPQRHAEPGEQHRVQREHRQLERHPPNLYAPLTPAGDVRSPVLRAVRVLVSAVLLDGPAPHRPRRRRGAAHVGPGDGLAGRGSRPAASLAARIDRLPGVVSVHAAPVVGPGLPSATSSASASPSTTPAPAARTFVQRVVLLHRSTDRPTVLVTEGYGVSTDPVRGRRADLDPRRPTRSPSSTATSAPSRPARPTARDWARQLTIRQAAADLHRVVTSFRGSTRSAGSARASPRAG